jgi:hypothetical protein
MYINKLKIIVFYTLIALSNTAFAFNDLTLVCTGIREFNTLPINSEAIKEKRTKTYNFKDGSPWPYILKCNWTEKTISCGYTSRDYKGILSIDRFSGDVYESEMKNLKLTVKGFEDIKGSLEEFKGSCVIGKKKF